MDDEEWVVLKTVVFLHGRISRSHQDTRGGKQ